ncbi:MAG TPA: 4-hydroxythreonine-4-phosphate dehydrogenase PdxA [Verrucomicrobiae bacterium]|jgi:4-hydroxythreonine-4-phosphate dehydrogenase|nr:4-hydroxythreonine-4-phosphate dehydrogenase PdxA [Verrucomicrobiae bacterium]
MTGLTAISLGDVTGIGPEVTLKALAAEAEIDDARYLLIGDANYLAATSEKLGLQFPFQSFPNPSKKARFLQYNPLSNPLPPGLEPGAPAAARMAVASLTFGAQCCLRNETDALVTAPLSKQAVVRSRQPFIGQTEFLSELAGEKRTIMMLLGDDDRGRWLRVALATTHLPLKSVPAQLSAEKVGLAVELAALACRDLGLARQRVAVCGLNPHAGEGGEFGTEEITVIKPAVDAARRKGFDVTGPLPADTVFHYAYRGNYDAVVAMYHDQGLGPLKMVAFERGVNWTLGLPFIRTSPDHGTAYDIAGKGVADPSSMIAAIRLAKQLARQRPKPL